MNASNQLNQTSYTNYSNTSYPNQYNYSYPQYNQSANYYTQNNASTQLNATNQTIYSNASYPNQYNYSYPQYNQTANNQTYMNASNQLNQTSYTNYSNTSYQNQYNYSYPQQNQSANYYTSNPSNLTLGARQKLQQSKISLKLRNQDILHKQINQTQTIEFYNQSIQQYQQIVIFNQTDLYKPQFNNVNDDVWYYYQDNELITLVKGLDSNGNIVYRNATLQFNLQVAEYPLIYTASQGQKNIVFYGTLVQGQSGVQANYQYQNDQNKQVGDQYFGNFTKQYKDKNSIGQFNFQNGHIDTQVNKSSSTAYQSSQQTQQDSNQASESSFISNTNSNENKETINRQIDINSNSSNVQKVQYSTQNQNQYQYEKINQNGTVNAQTTDLSSQQQVQINTTSSKQNNAYTQTVQSNQNNLFQASQTNEYQNGNQFETNETINQQSFNNLMNSTTYSEGDQGSYQQQSQSSSNTTHIDINKTQNSTQNYNIYNLTTNDIQNTREIDQQIQEGQVNQSYNSSTVNIYNQTNVENIVNINGNQTTFDSSQTEIDREYSQSGDKDPVQSTSSSSSQFTNSSAPNQQLNQLRGSKRQASGAWNKLEEKKFANSNSVMVKEAINAVDSKFNPQKEGFEFDSIISVHEQLVAGFNYNIKLRYENNQSQQQNYEVVIYSIPWANKPNEITSCIRFDGEQE